MDVEWDANGDDCDICQHTVDHCRPKMIPQWSTAECGMVLEATVIHHNVQ